VVYADNSARDVQTAKAFLEGFGCRDDVAAFVANASLPQMEPVLSDCYTQPQCPLANEEQTKGLYGGDTDALTSAYAELIAAIAEVLDMTNAPNVTRLCKSADASSDCSFFDLAYQWTGLYFQGMFKSPLYVFKGIGVTIFHFSSTLDCFPASELLS
jgi:hypothetical protein